MSDARDIGRAALITIAILAAIAAGVVALVVRDHEREAQVEWKRQ